MSVIQRLAHAAPVGVHLVDAVTRQTVTDGIDVWITAAGRRQRAAVRTPSGVFAAHGLRRPERWEVSGDDPPAEPLDVGIQVRDRSGHYYSFAAEAEVDPTGYVRVICAGSLPTPVDVTSHRIPLFSRPVRPAPAGMATVRAVLALLPDGAPAAYAALEVSTGAGAEPAVGIADERGEVLVTFPYPRPAGFSDSPPSGPRGPLANVTWEADVRAYLPAVDPGAGDLPDLCALLSRTPARLLTAASPPSELGPQELRYGHELVLRSARHDPVLLVGA